MALRYKTIKLMEDIAERLENWAKEWGEQLLKDRPDNLRQLRESVLASKANTDFPHLIFKMEFCSSLKEALKGFDYILEELQQYMNNVVQLVQEKYDKLMDDTNSVGQLNVDSCEWLRKVNDSRNGAISLAKTLRHIAEIARGELASEESAETEQKATLSKGRRIWIGVKRIPRWIYVLVIFLAALLTIFYYLGWLEQIKNLFASY